MIKPQLKNICLTSMLLSCRVAFAAPDVSFIQQGQPYQEVKQTLLARGWVPVKNNNIEQSSLYAQEVYAMGMSEVSECISMEIDGCTFMYQKGKQMLEIKTITRQFSVESFRMMKKNAR